MHASLLRFLPGALLIICVLALVCVEALAGLALAAPAPFARPDRSGRRIEPLIGPGRYEMTWGGTACDLWLLPGGYYRCDFCGQTFTGTWDFSPGTNTLSVSETTRPEDARAWRWWSIRLCPKRTGRTSRELNYPDTPITIRRVP